MKILIINTSDLYGGAARAAYRLHRALVNEGVDCKMLVQTKLGGDYTVISPSSVFQKIFSKFRPHLDTLLIKKIYRNKTDTLFSPAWIPSFGLIDQINKIKPDIVHLHWICGGMMRIEELKKINSPIVWSLHDNWAFTGGCHIKWACEKYRDQCGSCPRLGSKNSKDISRRIFKRKERIYSKISSLTIIGLSRWINKCSQKSKLFKNSNTYNLPNPIDTEIFRPFHKNNSRELWKFPENKKIILFGAPVDDINKGFKELFEAVKLLKTMNVEIVIFGSSIPENFQSLNFKFHFLGSLLDDTSLITLYSAADVFVVPSLQENLSNSIMESLSCGTPVVAFDIGGNSDMIEHEKNGYLAKAYSADDLACGIEWIINHNNYNELSLNARKKIVENFDSKIVAHKYIKMYNEILNKIR